MTYRDRILRMVSQFPPWFIRAARVSEYIPSHKPTDRGRLAEYEHITRTIRVVPGIVGQSLKRAVVHELAHAVDDNFGMLHYFSESPEWIALHRFYLAGEDTTETFAEHVSRYLLDPVAYRQAVPVTLLVAFVERSLDYLKQNFS